MTIRTLRVLAPAVLALVGAGVFAATAPEMEPAKAISYTELIRTAKPDTDFKIVYKPGLRSFLIVAPHGGNIEPGSTELAEAISGGDYGYYSFSGLKRDSSSIFVPSSRFDEPDLMRVAKTYAVVISIHVVEGSDMTVFVGGNNKQYDDRITKSLRQAGFDVKAPPGTASAWNRYNIVNRNVSGGTQIELSSALVEEMFRGPASSERVRQDPNRRTAQFDNFVAAVQSVLGRSREESSGIRIHTKDDKKK